MTKKVSFLVLVSILIFFIAKSQNWTQIGQDIDGEASGDHSGKSVSLNSSGSIVAIGAPTNDGTGSDSGHVRIFENQGGTWLQIGQDIDGEAHDDHFGASVCLNSEGSIVAIGALYNEENGSFSGHVRIFEYQTGIWIQIGQDIVGEFGDMLGASVSLNSEGSIVAIGAPANYVASKSGYARIYENQNGYWTQIGQEIIGEAAGDLCGASISLNSEGFIIAIGAPSNNGGGVDNGHVRIYENQDGIWTQIGQDIDGEAAHDWSGSSVSLSSNGFIVAIGAYYNDGNGNNSGHVRVYENQGGTWTQIGQDIDGEEAGDESGRSVSLSSDGSIMATGALYNDGNGFGSGHARIHENLNGIWTQVGQDINGEAAYDGSGLAVSLSSDGSIIAIGAFWNNGIGGYFEDAGHVRVYKNLHTNISKFTTKGINIYPNPTNTILYFRFSDNTIQKLTISDIAGNQIVEKTGNLLKEAIDLSVYKSGIYIVSIKTDNRVFAKKIVKK